MKPSFDKFFRWGTVEHPTFGRVPRVVTIKDLKAGTELTCHYMIDMEEAADETTGCAWYVQLWDEFSKGKRSSVSSDDMDLAEDQDSNDSNYVTPHHLNI